MLSTLFKSVSMALITSLLLIACGSGNNPATPATPQANNPPTPAAPQANNQLAAYQGAWKDTCRTILSTAIPQTPVASQQAIILITAPKSNGSVDITESNFVYQNTNCSGSPAVTVTYPNQIYTFTSNGTKTIADSVVVDRIDVAQTAGTATATSTLSGVVSTTATELRITFPGAEGSSFELSIPAETFKLIGRVSGNTFFFGESSSPGGVDAQGYANSLETSLTK